MSFEVKDNKASEWINQWKDSFDSIKPDTSSLKTFIYLTLLEKQNEPLSYQDIADELKNRGVINGDMDLVALRNGMYQIVKALKTDRHYEIEKMKNGKESSHLLRERSQSALKQRSGEIVRVLDDPELAPSTKFVAEKLMRDRRMPFYGIYLPMRAASRWVLYSEKEAKDRSKYEGKECERLLREWLSKDHGNEVSIIGLGVGEGIGEIEIISRLLDKNRNSKTNGDDYNFKRIHYCAIDTNVHLLMDHIERLKDKFEAEIKANKLVCGVICGNFLEDFPRLLKRLRTQFVESGYFDSEGDFLPRASGTLITMLGNVLGNIEQRASEGAYFRPAIEELKGYDLAFLLGVSIQQEAAQEQGEKQIVQESYRRDLEDLLLATPRYLTHELTLLETHPENDQGEEEFVLPEDEEERKKRWPPLEQITYQGDGLLRGTHVKGQIYEFYYKTRWDLTMTVDGEELRVPADTSLLLYNIIKFDRNSLIKFLVESKNLYEPHEETKPGAINSGDEKRSYVIIALTNMPPGEKE